MKFLVKKIQMKDNKEWRRIHSQMLNTTCTMDAAPTVGEMLWLSFDYLKVHTSTVECVETLDKTITVTTKNTVYVFEEVGDE